MSRNYDSWEKLVAAVLKREKFRRLAHCESFSTSISSDLSARSSFDFDVPHDIDRQTDQAGSSNWLVLQPRDMLLLTDLQPILNNLKLLRALKDGLKEKTMVKKVRFADNVVARSTVEAGHRSLTRFDPLYSIF